MINTLHKLESTDTQETIQWWREIALSTITMPANSTTMTATLFSTLNWGSESAFCWDVALNSETTKNSGAQINTIPM